MKHIILFRFLFVISFFVSGINLSFAQSPATVTIPYTGFQACGGCTVCGADYWCFNTLSSYCGNTAACGTKTFNDPVPPGNIVTSINIQYYTGNCGGGSLTATINGSTYPTVNEGSGGCLCSNSPCGVSAPPSAGTFPCGITNAGYNYVYGGSNTFQLCTGSDVCINRAVLTISYAPSNQSTPANQPTNPTGNTSPCAGTSQTYTASSPNAASYNWTVPAGWTITSGQGTGSVTVTAGSGSGNICVTASNACGTSAASCTAVTPSANSTDPSGASATPNPICTGSSTTLSISGGTLSTGASWNWYSGSCGGTFVGTGTSISVSPSSTTTYFVRGEGGCNTTNCTSVTVTFNSASTDPSGATASTNPTCGGSATLTVSGGSLGTGASWNWYSGSCGGSFVGSGSSVSVSPSSTTSYFVQASGTCNTTSCATVTVTVDQAATANAGSNASICSNGAYQLSGSIGGSATSLTWSTSGTGTFDNNTISNATYTPSLGDASLGSVVLTITTNDPPGPCNAATSSITLTFDASATASAGADDAICSGSTYTLSGSIGGSASSLSWGTSGTGTFDNPSIANATYTPSGTDVSSGTVTIFISTNSPPGCPAASDTMVLTIAGAPTVNAGGNNSVCAGNSIALSGSFGGSASSVTWSTSGTGIFNNPNLPNAIYTPSSAEITAGSVTLTLTTNDPPGTCNAVSDNITLTIEQAATANAGTDDMVCSGSSYSLSGSIGGSATNLNWASSGTGIFDNTSISNATYTPSATDITTGTVQLIITTNDPAGVCNAASDTMILSIADLDDAGFSYISNSFCISGTNPFPSITGLTGGTFTGVAGISVNSSSGEIDLNSSSVGGPYDITYSTNGNCPVDSIFNVSITDAPDPTFSYPVTQYCMNASSATPIIIPPAIAGTFSASPAGLTFVNTGTGEINPSASAPATYVITNSIAATSGCPATSATTTVQIMSMDNPAFNYAQNMYCISSANPFPNISGLPGGTFSGVSGISVNSSTGEIDIAASSVGGPYSITYVTNGSCPDSSTFQVSIAADGDPSFSYSDTLFCKTSFSTNPTPTINGTTGGTFSGTAGLVFVSTATGQINISASSAGTYDITYNTGGSCPNDSTVQIIISPKADASINPPAIFCAVDPPVNFLPYATQSGGSWSGFGIIDPVNGTFNPAVAGAGNHTITYIIGGLCPDTGTSTVIVTPKLNATITSDSIFCDYYEADTLTAVNTLPSDVWIVGGSFIAPPAPPIINPGSLAPGTYTIEHRINQSCGDTAFGTLTIIYTPDATINQNLIPLLCNTSDTFTLTAVDTGGYWYSISPGVQNSFTGLFNPTLVVNSPTTIMVYHTNADTSGTCSSIDSTNISIGRTAIAPATVSDTVCMDDEKILYATGTNDSLNWYAIDALGNFVLVKSANTSYSPEPPVLDTAVADSMYVFYVQQQNGNCPSAYAPVSLTVINIGASFVTTPIDTGEIPLEVVFSNTSFGADSIFDFFHWAFGDGDTSVLYNPIHMYEDTGDFIITLKVSDGYGVCLETYTYTIHAKGTSRVEVPNIFTPNGDGMNDVFNVIYKNLSQSEGIIYNRWGELIYQWSSVDAGWDGRTMSGTLAPDGVYYYIIKATGKDKPEPDPKIYEFSGHVTLVR